MAAFVPYKGHRHTVFVSLVWDCAVINQEGVVVHLNTAGDDEAKGLNQLLSPSGTHGFISCVFLLCLAPGCELDWPHQHPRHSWTQVALPQPTVCVPLQIPFPVPICKSCCYNHRLGWLYYKSVFTFCKLKTKKSMQKWFESVNQ